MAVGMHSRDTKGMPGVQQHLSEAGGQVLHPSIRLITGAKSAFGLLLHRHWLQPLYKNGCLCCKVTNMLHDEWPLSKRCVECGLYYCCCWLQAI